MTAQNYLLSCVRCNHPTAHTHTNNQTDRQKATRPSEFVTGAGLRTGPVCTPQGTLRVHTHTHTHTHTLV